MPVCLCHAGQKEGKHLQKELLIPLHLCCSTRTASCHRPRPLLLWRAVQLCHAAYLPNSCNRGTEPTHALINTRQRLGGHTPLFSVQAHPKHTLAPVSPPACSPLQISKVFMLTFLLLAAQVQHSKIPEQQLRTQRGCCYSGRGLSSQLIAGYLRNDKSETDAFIVHSAADSSKTRDVCPCIYQVAPHTNIREYPQSHQEMLQVPQAIGLWWAPVLFQVENLRQTGKETDKNKLAGWLPVGQMKTTNHGPFHACKGCPGRSLGVQSNRETAEAEMHPRQSSSTSTQAALSVQKTRYKQSCPSEQFLIISTLHATITQLL